MPIDLEQGSDVGGPGNAEIKKFPLRQWRQQLMKLIKLNVRRVGRVGRFYPVSIS